MSGSNDSDTEQAIENAARRTTGPLNKGVQIRFGDTLVQRLPTGSRVIFADGATLDGFPIDDAGYRATALELGYGADTLALCLDHDMTHVAMCYWLGTDSPALNQTCRGTASNGELQSAEEAAVLAIQRFARLAGIDLADRFHNQRADAAGPRPFDA